MARHGRHAMLLAATLALAAGGAAAVDAPTSAEELADIYSAEDWQLSPGQASVLAGGDLELELGVLECMDDGLLCALVHSPRPEAVAGWRVNGVAGGDASVGTVSRGAGGRWIYRAPAQLPRVNPVSVAAVVDGKDGVQAQLVSNIQVLATGWSGHVQVSFEASAVSQGDARHETTLGDDPMYTARGLPAYEIKRVLSIGGDVEVVSFAASYAVTGAMVESFADDGSGLAILELGVPAVAFSYDRVQKSGTSLGCRYTLGNSTTTEVDGGPDLEQYRAIPPSPVTFNINADGSSTIMAIPPALTTMSGRTLTFACDGDIGVGEIGPLMEAMGDTSALSDSFRGVIGQRGVYRGDLRLPGTMNVMGSHVQGTYRITWNIRRARA